MALIGILAVRVCQFLYLYQNKEYCRCVQSKCCCSGFEMNCTYPMGKLCYELELEESFNDKPKV